MKQKIMEVLEAEQMHNQRSAKLDSDQFLKYVLSFKKKIEKKIVGERCEARTRYYVINTIILLIIEYY